MTSLMETSTGLVQTTLPASHGPVALAARTSVLAFITVFAFVSNLILLVTIAQSTKLRSVQLNQHIISLALVNMLTCILGMPMVIGYSVTEKWDYGDFMCSLLAHFILSVSIMMSLGIMMMNIDRIIAVTNPNKYTEVMVNWKTRFLLGLVWMIGVFMPIPISLGQIPASPYLDRYLCSVAAGAPLDYLLTLYLVCFCGPSIISILSYLYIARVALNEKDAQQEGGAAITGPLWPEMRGAGFVFSIFILWVLFEMPYVTLSSIQQYRTSLESNEIVLYPYPLFTALMWLKLGNTIFLPLAVFRWRKEIWIKFKDLMFCRKTSKNVVAASGEKNNNNRRKPTKSSSTNAKFEAQFKVPTLFASKGGLRVHGSPETDIEMSEVFYADMNMTGKSGDLDGLNREALGEEESSVLAGKGDDTSDYDTDPYAQSDPISVRSQTHSDADPRGKEFRTKANSISADSGRGSAHNSVNSGKRRRKRRTHSGETVEPIEHIITAEAEFNVTESSQQPPRHRKQRSHSGGETATDTGGERQSLSSRETKIQPVSPREKPEFAAHNLITDSIILEAQPVDETTKSKRKKKKKKRKVDVADCETNTTQVLDIPRAPTPERPPYRLEPLNHDVYPMATPPLRGKVVPHIKSRPPTGEVSEPRRMHRDVQGEESTPLKELLVRKKKRRDRKTSGDSDRTLMSSNASAESYQVINQGYKESQI